jgi:hypothetical protein
MLGVFYFWGMAKVKTSAAKSTKVTFGKRRDGKAKKRNSPMDKNEKPSRGQG